VTHPHADAADLAAFGYRQRLDRTLGGVSAFAASCSYLSILTGLPQLFYSGYAAAGPAFFWTWPVVFLGQFLIALCFAELAARYPLAGCLYQWATQVGPSWLGWLAGWVHLACSIITLAAVALALQATLPQVSSYFHLVGTPGQPADAARNAVLLGCILLVFSTTINVVGVRLLARINNVGAFTEMSVAGLLILLLFAAARRGPAVAFMTSDRGAGSPLGYLGAFLAAALAPTFVMFGFEAAGSLAEETDSPRKQAPKAILGALAAVGATGTLLIIAALQAAPDLLDPALGRSTGGFAYIIRVTLGDLLGLLLLIGIALAVTAGTLTVHAASVRLMFAMARDGRLPASRALSHVNRWSRTPTLPAALLGACAMAVLVIHWDFPHVIETMTAVAVVWANLAYLLVTAPMLVRRLCRGWASEPGGFSLGNWGLPVNVLAVIWGVLVIVNIGWPRPLVYGPSGLRRFSAPIATVAVVVIGLAYYALALRHRRGVLAEHRAADAPGSAGKRM
jgi:urea carboxylase system permease